MNQFLKKQLLDYKSDLIVQVTIAVLTTILTLIVPYIEGTLINVVVYEKNIERFLSIVAVLFVTVLMRLVFSYFTAKIKFIKLPLINIGIIRSIIKKNLKVESDSIVKYEGTYLHTRINDDSNTILSFLFFVIPSLITGLIIVVGVIGFTVYFESRIFLFFLIFLLLYIFVYTLTKDKLYQSSLHLKDAYSNFFSQRNSLFLRYTSIKAKQIENFELEHLNQFTEKMIEKMKTNFKWNYILSTSKITLTLIFQVFFFIIGGWFVIYGMWGIGTFTIMMQYFTMILGTLDTFFSAAVDYQGYKASVTRMNEILDLPEENIGIREIDKIEKIEFKNFNLFLSEKLEAPMYKHPINYSFFPGEIYSISGENGVGKTTFIFSLIGINKNFTGTILINNEKLLDLNLPTFRKNNIAVMLQNENVENIKVETYLSKFNVKFREVLDNTDSFFKSDTFNVLDYLDENLENLSGGERQLICLFAMLSKQNTSLIILDEPFSNIAQDILSELMETIKIFAGREKIVIIVSHDSTIIKQTKQVKLEKN